MISSVHFLSTSSFEKDAPNDVENAAELIEFSPVLLTATVKSFVCVGIALGMSFVLSFQARCVSVCHKQMVHMVNIDSTHGQI